LRVVLDTNVLIAAFVARGHCHELLEHVARSHRLSTSEAILVELHDKLIGKFGVPAEKARRAVDLLRSRMAVIEIAPLAGPVCRDPDDDLVLATAVAARADCLITGDADLLVLERYSEIPILRPGEFWALEAGREEAGGR